MNLFRSTIIFLLRFADLARRHFDGGRRFSIAFPRLRRRGWRCFHCDDDLLSVINHHPSQSSTSVIHPPFRFRHLFRRHRLGGGGHICGDVIRTSHSLLESGFDWKNHLPVSTSGTRVVSSAFHILSSVYK